MSNRKTKQNQTPRLSDLSEQRDTLVMEHKVLGLKADVRAAKAMLNRADMMEAGQMFADRSAHLYDTPGFGGGSQITSGYPSMPQDRKQGRNRPFFSTEQQLAEQRGIARVIATTDETGIGVLKNLTNYIIGSGFEYEAVASDDIDTGGRSMSSSKRSKPRTNGGEPSVKSSSEHAATARRFLGCITSATGTFKSA
jgi:hypothetical protein